MAVLRLKDYMVEADVQLLGQYGDAGLIIRASNEEEGVDAYDGYYAGMRDLDNTLILGRAGYGWIEYQARRVTPRVYAQQWYHIKLLAFGCHIVATATSPSGQTTIDAIQEPNCIQSGRFGLKSLSEWRTVAECAGARRHSSRFGESDRRRENSSCRSRSPSSDQRESHATDSEPVRVRQRYRKINISSRFISTCASIMSIPTGQPIANLRASLPTSLHMSPFTAL